MIRPPKPSCICKVLNLVSVVAAADGTDQEARDRLSKLMPAINRAGRSRSSSGSRLSSTNSAPAISLASASAIEKANERQPASKKQADKLRSVWFLDAADMQVYTKDGQPVVLGNSKQVRLAFTRRGACNDGCMCLGTWRVQQSMHDPLLRG